MELALGRTVMLAVFLLAQASGDDAVTLNVTQGKEIPHNLRGKHLLIATVDVRSSQNKKHSLNLIEFDHLA